MSLYLKIALPVAGLILGIFSLTVPEGARSQPPTNEAPPDAIAQAQTPKEAPLERPEQKKTAHDLSDIFNPSNAVPSSEALTNQTDRGQMNGFDFYRDPLGATRPGMTFDDFYRAGVANKPQVVATQRRLLESRYNLEPKLDPVVTMSRGKPLAVGPTAKLPAGMTWEALAALSPAEIRDRDIFPYKALPHAAQGGGLGGQVFPPDADQDVSAAGAVRRRVRSSRGVFARVSAGDVSAKPARAGRRLPRRSGLDQQLLPLVQRHLDSRAARWPAVAGDAIPARRIQPDRRSQDCSAQLGSDVPGLSYEWPHKRSVPHHSRHQARAAAHSTGHRQSPRPVQSTNSWVEAEPTFGRGLYRV